MKKTITILSAVLLMACTQKAQENVSKEIPQGVHSYGEVITEDGLMSAADLKNKLAQADSVDCTISATINETCAMKGCWMTLDAGLDDEMRVRFKDYGFFVPTEGQSGKRTVLHGKAFKSVTTVDDLKHYAQDAGKSEEEIEAITEPEVAINFLADGVLIYD